MAEHSITVPRIGATFVRLSDGLIDAFSALGIQVSGFGDTQIVDGIADFLITGGAADLDTTKVEIIHSGGLTFTAGDTTVALTDFVISNLGERTVLTGLVTANDDLVGRVPLFDLQIGNIETSTQNDLVNLDLENVAVGLSEEAAAALNQIFAVDAFTAGFNIGTAEVDAFVDPNGDVVQVDQQIASPIEEPETAELLPIQISPFLEVVPISTAADFIDVDPASLTSTLDITQAGDTSVMLSHDLVNALRTLNIEAEGFGSTQVNQGAVDFLITGGAADLDATKVEIIHSGGLSLKAGETTVNLTDFVISTLDDQAVLTGLVTINGDLLTRATLFDLQVGDIKTSTQREQVNLELESVGVTLTNDAATVLNQAFAVDAFTGGFNIGMAEVDALLI
jgi:hypothetical protein